MCEVTDAMCGERLLLFESERFGESNVSGGRHAQHEMRRRPEIQAVQQRYKVCLRIILFIHLFSIFDNIFAVMFYKCEHCRH
jgi:hypothetical protein